MPDPNDKTPPPVLPPDSKFQDVEKPAELHKQKQESLDKAFPKIANVTAEMEASGGPEKYKNEDLVLRLVAFAKIMESGKHGVGGKSPSFVLERFAAAMNCAAPHVILDAPLKRDLERYKVDWLRVRARV